MLNALRSYRIYVSGPDAVLVDALSADVIMTSLNLKFVPSSKDSSSSSLSRLHSQVIQTVQAAYPDLKPRLVHLADSDSIVVQGVTELNNELLYRLHRKVRGLTFELKEECLRLYIHRRQRSVRATCVCALLYIGFGATLLAGSVVLRSYE